MSQIRSQRTCHTFFIILLSHYFFHLMYFVSNSIAAVSNIRSTKSRKNVGNNQSLSSSSSDNSYGSESSASISVISARSTGSTKYIDGLVFDSRWKEATEYVKQNGRHAMKYRRSPQFMNINEDSLVLPIHVALTKADVTLEFLEALIFAYPNSLKKQDSVHRRGCLHIAVKSRVPDHIISYLLRMYPEGVTLQDSMGRVPLHYAVSNLRSLSLLSELIAACPRSIWAQDRVGWSPLHVAAGTLASSDIVKLFLSKSKEIITLTTTKGRTPMVVAKESDNQNKDEIINMLANAQKSLERLPTFQNMRDAERRSKNIFAVMSEVCLA
jgi:hypothetical protein